MEQQFSWNNYDPGLFRSVIEYLSAYTFVDEPSYFYNGNGHSKFEYRFSECSIHIHVSPLFLKLNMVSENESNNPSKLLEDILGKSKTYLAPGPAGYYKGAIFAQQNIMKILYQVAAQRRKDNDDLKEVNGPAEKVH